MDLNSPSREEIDNTLNAAQEHVDQGVASWPGMTYEQGVVAGIEWVMGHTKDNPMTE